MDIFFGSFPTFSKSFSTEQCGTAAFNVPISHNMKFFHVVRNWWFSLTLLMGAFNAMRCSPDSIALNGAVFRNLLNIYYGVVR